MVKSIFSSVFWKICASVCSFFTIPVLLNKIGVDNYAVWVTLTSLVGWLSFFDFGTGNSIRNIIAENESDKNDEIMQTAIRGNFTLLCLSVLLAFVAFIGSLFLVDIFKSYPLLSVVVYIPLIISLPTFLGPFLLQGLGKFNILNFVQFLSQISWFIFLMLIPAVQLNNLLFLSFGFSIIQLVFRIVIFILGIKPIKIPFRSLLSIRCLVKSKESIKSGLQFLILQVTALVLFSLGNVLTYAHLDPKDVSTFDVINKILIFLISFFNIIITIFWTEISKSKAANDYIKLRGIWQNLFLITLVINVLLIGSSYLLPWFIEVWTNGKIVVRHSVLWWFLFQFVVQSFAYAGAVFLNAFEILKSQIYFAVGASVVFYPLTIFLFKYFQEVYVVPMTVTIVLIPSLIYSIYYSLKITRNVADRSNP